ncbi:hypothetical protein K474DRAFT_1710416 [Panus rudis PR-1116 ss-1]|nr:hypothetical protein K474DRAFT_1710416 [Panus rudis PR-1116 ss-1]
MVHKRLRVRQDPFNSSDYQLLHKHLDGSARAKQILDSNDSDHSEDDGDDKKTGNNQGGNSSGDGSNDNSGRGNDNSNTNGGNTAGNGDGNGQNGGNNSNSNNSDNNSQQTNATNASGPPGGPPGPGNRIFPPGRGCQFVNENDGRIQYSGLWTLEAKDPRGFTTTTHTSTSAGSLASMYFNSSMVIVVGVVHPSNDSFPPASANYTIDDDYSVELSLPVTNRDIPNQQFFQSPALTPGVHQLTINVTSNGSPYTLDYLFLCGNSTGAIAATISSAGPRQELWSKKAAIIVGSILGSMMLLLLIALACVLCNIRKRKTRGIRSNNSPLKEWLSRQTMFTSSDSIMRNNPTNPSAPSTLDPKDKLPDISRRANDPEDVSESYSPRAPVIRTFDEFDRHYSFPVLFPVDLNRDLPMSPISGTPRDLSLQHPPLPPKTRPPF